MQEKEILESDILQSNNVNNNNINNNIIENSPLDNSADSIESYIELNQGLKKCSNGKMDKKKSGGFKTPIFKTINTNNNKVKNNKIVSFLKRNNNNNVLQIEPYKIGQKEAVFYAFLQVLDGNSPKIVSPSSETNVGETIESVLRKYFKNKNNVPTYIIYIYILYSLLNQYNIILSNSRCNCRIKHNLNKISNEIKKNPSLFNKEDISLINELLTTINEWPEYVNSNDYTYIAQTNSEKFKSICEKIFAILNIYLINVPREQKEQIFDAFTQLFFLVLFTNKTDIKEINALINETNNKITNIDPLFHILENDDIFFNHKYAPDFITINKHFLSTSFDIIANEDNPAFEKYLERYTLDEEKIKAIVKQATENLDRIEIVNDDSKCDKINKIITNCLKDLYSHTYKKFAYFMDKIITIKNENKNKNKKNFAQKLSEVLSNNLQQIHNFCSKNNDIKEIINNTLQRQQNIKRKLKINNNQNYPNRLTKRQKNIKKSNNLFSELFSCCGCSNNENEKEFYFEPNNFKKSNNLNDTIKDSLIKNI